MMRSIKKRRTDSRVMGDLCKLSFCSPLDSATITLPRLPLPLPLPLTILALVQACRFLAFCQSFNCLLQMTSGYQFFPVIVQVIALLPCCLRGIGIGIPLKAHLTGAFLTGSTNWLLISYCRSHGALGFVQVFRDW